MIAGAPISGHPISGRRATGRRHPPGGAFRRAAALCLRVFTRPREVRRVFARSVPATGRVFQWRPGMPHTIPADTLPKTVQDARYFAFDFSKFPELADDDAVLLSDPAPTIRGGSGLTLGAATVITAVFDGIPAFKGVKVLISGGTDDLAAPISCVAYVTPTERLEVPGRLVVDEVV